VEWGAGKFNVLILMSHITLLYYYLFVFTPSFNEPGKKVKRFFDFNDVMFSF